MSVVSRSAFSNGSQNSGEISFKIEGAIAATDQAPLARHLLLQVTEELKDYLPNRRVFSSMANLRNILQLEPDSEMYK